MLALKRPGSNPTIATNNKMHTKFVSDFAYRAFPYMQFYLSITKSTNTVSTVNFYHGM
jgi:hypothetical protein